MNNRRQLLVWALFAVALVSLATAAWTFAHAEGELFELLYGSLQLLASVAFVIAGIREIRKARMRASDDRSASNVG